MSKFFGSIFSKKKTTAVNTWVPYKPPPLTIEEVAISTLIFCATTHRGLPEGISEILDALVPSEYKTPYGDLLEAWKNKGSLWSDVLDEIEVLYSILLERAIKSKRQENKDVVWSPATAIPAAPDIYDKIDY